MATLAAFLTLFKKTETQFREISIFDFLYCNLIFQNRYFHYKKQFKKKGENKLQNAVKQNNTERGLPCFEVKK